MKLTSEWSYSVTIVSASAFHSWFTLLFIEAQSINQDIGEKETIIKQHCSWLKKQKDSWLFFFDWYLFTTFVFHPRKTFRRFLVFIWRVFKKDGPIRSSIHRPIDSCAILNTYILRESSRQALYSPRRAKQYVSDSNSFFYVMENRFVTFTIG